MSEVFWPGDGRAGALCSDAAFVAAMVGVEAAWLDVLADAGLAPRADRLTDVDPGAISDAIADAVEAGGNPVIPLVAALRSGLDESVRPWLHRGLTSQDVLDTALMLCLRDTADAVLVDLRRQVDALRRLAVVHRRSVQVGRTLTQHAVPTTFGVTAAGWLGGILDAAEDLTVERDRLAVQAGGAAGTMALVVEFGGDPVAFTEGLAARLGLRATVPWHTSRRPVTRIADVLVACVDAWGRMANDVALRCRPEFAELAEAAPGGSSTMPHKRNPVLSILLKRAALGAPSYAAQLHAAAAAAVDDRPDGAWHAEWMPLRLLARLAATAASQAAELVEGLVVHADRMRSTAEAAHVELLAEAGREGSLESYLGISDRLVDRAVERADAYVGAAR